MDAATLVYDIDSSRARTAVTDLNKLTNESVKLARAFGQSDQALRQANGRFSSSADVARRYGAEIQNLADKYNPALSAALRFQRAEVEVNRALALGVINKKQAADQIARLGREMQTTSAITQRASGVMRGFGAQFIAFSAATFGIRQVATTLAGFEKSMAGVQAVTNATARDMESLRATAQRLGSTTEYTASQAAEGLRFLGMAGFSTAQSMEAIPAVLDLATAASMDLGSAADITSNIMSAFAISAADASSVADILAVAASSANTDVAQLGDAMSYVGPVAQSLGISLNDAAAAVGALSNAGIQGSMAGTGLRRVLSSLANPTSKARGELQSLGVTLESVNPQTNDLVDIIDTLAASGIDAAQALTIFGDRGGPALLALVEQRQGLRDLTDSMDDVTGAAGRMAGYMRDNLGGDFNSFMASVEGLVLALGDAGLTAALRGVTQGITGVVAVTSGAVGAVGKVTGSVEGLASAFGILALTQMPRTVTATRAIIASNGLATASSMALTRAMQAQAFAAAAAGRAMALAGGPIGIALGTAGALTVAWLNGRDRANQYAEALGQLETAQDSLNKAQRRFYETSTVDALKAWEVQLQVARDAAKLTLDMAQARAESVSFFTNFFGYSLSAGAGVAEVNAELDRMRGEFAVLEVHLAAIPGLMDQVRRRTGEAADEMENLTEAQQSALSDARDMLTAATRRIELLRIQAQYGKDIAAVQVMQYRNERDLFAAKVATLDVADDIKQALMDTWEEEKRLTGETAEWDRAMNVLRGTATDVLQAMRDINAAEPGATWLDTAIGKAQTLADVLWDGLGALGGVRSDEELSAGGLGTRPGRRPMDLGAPRPDRGGRGGGGGKGKGGGKSEADTLREEMQRRWEVLNEAFQAEFSLAIAAYAKDQETLEWALETRRITQEQYVQQVAMLRVQAFGTEFEQQQLQYQMDQEALKMALEQKIISYEEYYRRLKELQFQNLMSDVNRTDMAQDLSNTAQYFGMLNTLTGNGYDGLLRLQQTFAAASALISAYQGAVGAMAETNGPFWVRLAAYGKVLAAGLGAVAAIKGGRGGGGGAGGAGTAPAQEARQEPQRTVLVNLQGDEWLVGMAENILEQIYEQSKDGRVIVSRI